MRNATYVYFFKLDLNQEAIGNVMASSINEAREKIAVIKQLPIDDIDRLFVIKQKKGKS
jgi:hypothetical protein